MDQPYTYTGRELDSETSLYYYRARYYNPMTGRFLQKDPVGFFGGINLYRYVRNNPISLIDPTGLIPDKACYNCEEEALWEAYDQACKLASASGLDKEYGGTIYSVGGKFGYTFNSGTSSNSPGVIGEVGIPPAPHGATAVGVFHSHRSSDTFTPPHGNFPGDVQPDIHNYLIKPNCGGIREWDFIERKAVDLDMKDLKDTVKACRKM